MKRLLVTAALPYSNGRPHVGHIAGAYLPADIYVRYQRLLGREVLFVCGSDDHGVAIMLTAEQEGKSPAEVAAYYNQEQQKAFDGLKISFDIYGSTSASAYHQKVSQDFFLRIYEKGLFEKQSSKQFYDESRKIFLPDRFVKGECGYCGTANQNGDQCENCGKVLDVDTLKDAVSVFSGEPATVRETTHWFLDLSQCEDIVSDWIDKSLLRDHTRNYVRGLLSTGFVKRSMTRDIDWGIPVPLEDPDAEGKVLYVWFDAPIGYISNTLEWCEKHQGDPQKYEDWWKSEDCEILQFIGEDNTIFHCVIWIAMLQTEGTFQLPKGVIVNQFVNVQFPGREVEKMSKSRGTAIWISDYLQSGENIDALRYYLTAIAPERSRAVFRPDELMQRNNTDLANVIGNFVNRIVSFTTKYYGPEVPHFDEQKLGERDLQFLASIESTHKAVSEALEKCLFKQAQEELVEFARECNKYVDEKAPWKTRKTDEEETKRSLYVALCAIRYLGAAFAPFLPDTSQKILHMMGEKDGITWKDVPLRLEPGQKLGEAVILFRKMESLDWIPS